MNTVSFNLLGNYGRLGNCMFQYASTLGIARKLNACPTANVTATGLMTQCFKLGSVANTIVTQTPYLYQENTFSFDENLFELSLDGNMEIRGYFQTPKYFNHVEDEIKGDFQFVDPIIDWAITKIPKDEKTVSVHVRRGDYVNISKYHHNQTISYYEEAIEHFNDHRPIVFSDDIEWCKIHLSHLPNNPVFIEDNKYDINLEARKKSDVSGYVDMCAMGMCDAHIITNSSFSWWGAYLGGGTTVAPKTWFGPEGPQDWHDVYKKEWIIV